MADKHEAGTMLAVGVGVKEWPDIGIITAPTIERLEEQVLKLRATHEVTGFTKVYSAISPREWIKDLGSLPLAQ